MHLRLIIFFDGFAQELVASRDEALRSNEAMRVKLQEFEGNLRGVSEETLVILEKKEADLRKVEEEKREEKESHDRGARDRVHQTKRGGHQRVGVGVRSDSTVSCQCSLLPCWQTAADNLKGRRYR